MSLLTPRDLRKVLRPLLAKRTATEQTLLEQRPPRLQQCPQPMRDAIHALPCGDDLKNLLSSAPFRWQFDVLRALKKTCTVAWCHGHEGCFCALPTVQRLALAILGLVSRETMTIDVPESLGITQERLAHLLSVEFWADIYDRVKLYPQCAKCPNQARPTVSFDICICDLDPIDYDCLLKIALSHRVGKYLPITNVPFKALYLGTSRMKETEGWMKARMDRVTQQVCECFRNIHLNGRQQLMCVCELGQREGRGIGMYAGCMADQASRALAHLTIPAQITALSVEMEQMKQVAGEVRAVRNEEELRNRRQYFLQCAKCQSQEDGLAKEYQMCICNPRNTSLAPIQEMMKGLTHEELAALDLYDWDSFWTEPRVQGSDTGA